MPPLLHPNLLWRGLHEGQATFPPVGIWKGHLLQVYQKLQHLASYLRAVLGPDTLAGHELGGRGRALTKVSSSCGIIALATGSSM